MRCSNAPFNEFGLSEIIRDVEYLYLLVTAGAGDLNGKAPLDAGQTVGGDGADGSGGVTLSPTYITNNLSGLSGYFLQIANNLSDLNNVVTARVNLQLGDLALLNSPLSAQSGGTGTTTVARGDLLVGSASPNFWNKLTLGANARFLRSDGTDASWATIKAGDVPTVFKAGGTPRGTYAVDLQTYNLGTLGVALGAHSVICGGGDNDATTDYSAILGGSANKTTGAYASILNGISGVALGAASVILNGNTCSTSGDYSVVMGDESGTGGDHSFAMGYRTTTTSTIGDYGFSFGAYCVVGGLHSLCFGDHVETTGDYSLCFGLNITATSDWAAALGYAPTATAGDKGDHTFALYYASGIYVSGDLYRMTATGGSPVKILGVQGAAVTAPAGGGTVDNQARTAITDIISRLQGHGLIA